MTIAEKLRQEGEEKGIKKGTETVAMNLLRDGCEAAFVARNTGLSLDRCKQLLAQINREPTAHPEPEA